MCDFEFNLSSFNSTRHLTNMIQLRHSIFQLQNSSLVCCEPLAAAILGRFLTRYGILLELQMPLAKTETIAAVSHPQYNFVGRLQKKETVRAAVLQTVISIIASNGSTAPPLSSTPNASDSDEYGYN